MSEAKELLIPLLNPNEIDGLIAGLHVSEGQKVKAGDLLYTLETSKSAADVETEDGGYILQIQVEEGETVTAGKLFAYLAPSPEWQPPKQSSQKNQESDKSTVPDGLRITKPALLLAQENNLDLSSLPLGPMITEEVIRESLPKKKLSPAKLIKGPFPENAIIVYGGGGHGKSVIDILRSASKYELLGIIDDGLDPESDVMGVPVLGGKDILPHLFEEGLRYAVNAVGGIGHVNSRISVFKLIKETGFTCPTVIHPSAVVEATAEIAMGVQIFPMAYVGADTKIGFGTIINTGSIVSHDCQIGDYANISPGAILAGAVHVGDMSLIGMGATVNLNAEIGEKSLVGNGATVKKDVPAGGIVRAGSIWPK